MKIIFKPLFQKYLLYCFKNSLIVGSIILIEQLTIIFSMLNSLLSLFDDYSSPEIANFFTSILKFSPIYFVKNSLTCQGINNSNITVCNANSFLIIFQVLLTLLIMIFLIFFILEEILQNFRKEDNTAETVNDNQSFSDCLSNIFTYFFVNFLDFVIHFCSIGIFYMNFNEIIAFFNLLNSSNTSSILNPTSASGTNIQFSTIIIPVISILIVCFYIYLYISFIKNINLIIQYNKELSTHYDHLFSVKYDSTFFFIKILISLEDAFETNPIISKKSLAFIKITIIFIFMFFNTYMIYSNLITKKILYLSNHKFNIFRIFLSLYAFFVFIFILIFHSIFFQNMYVLCLCFFIALIVSIFFSIILNSFNFVAIYSTDNYILQLIYILNVKYNATDKEVKAEVSNIMFHHKNYCMHHRVCQICKMENFEFDSFLLNYFERTKHILKAKSSIFNHFEKNDILTYDIIKLLIIENLDKNKIIKLIYKARRILEKYEVKKRFDNNYFNIVIYNNYMKRLITKNQILKFKIIQCYEDTSYHINEALAIIETMLMALNNGEKHLFTKSSDLFLLKDKISKNVMFLSYYQNYFVDTYLIIIYRFIYKNLFNCEINDYVTIYNFEEIKDLINYKYNNERLIQIKLNFNNNSMKLLRLGKDLIDFRNREFDDLIPPEFKEHCASEMIRRIKSSDNEENKSFEYIITDTDNSLKSIKLNFTILASFKLDQVILIGQYDIIKEDLILLKKNYTNLDLENFNSNQENLNLKSDRSLLSHSNIDDNAANKYANLRNQNSFNTKSNEREVNLKFNKSSSKKKESKNKKNNNDLSEIDNKTNSSLKGTSNKKPISNKSTKIVSINKNQSSKNNDSYNGNLNESDISNKLIGKNKDFSKIFEKNLTLNKENKNTVNSGLASNETEIVNFSTSLQAALFIKTIWLNKIKLKYNIPFADIFEQINPNLKRTQEEIGKNVNLNICKINYDKYFLIYQRLLNYVEEEMNNDEIQENLRNFRHISKSSKISFYRFDFLYEILIINKENIYLLFKIKQIKNDDNEMEVINNHMGLPIEKGAVNNDVANNFNEEFEMEKLNSILKEKENTSVSSKSISANSKSDAFMNSDNSMKTISHNDQRMNKFTIFSLIFCIFLIFYCLFFLVIGITNNNNIRKLYAIKNNFNDFRYFFYHTSMNLFFNLSINKNDIDFISSNSLDTNASALQTIFSTFSPATLDSLTNSSSNKGSSAAGSTGNNVTSVKVNSNMGSVNKNMESLFFDKFKSDKTITINISKYVIEELSKKLNMLRDIYVNLQNAIYSSHYKDSLDVIFNHKTNFIQVNKVGNKFSVSFLEKFFFETINIFFNHGKVIVENISNDNYIYLSIINAKNNKVDFGNVDSSRVLITDLQVKMYEIMLNYVNYYKNFIDIGELINTFFSDSLTSVFNSTYLLSFISMGIHLFLFVGGIFIVKFLHKIIAQNDKMLCSSNDDDNIIFMRDKIKSIKNLNLLFVENPRKLVISINQKRADYMKNLYSNLEKRGKRAFNSRTKSESNGEKDNNLSLPALVGQDEKKNFLSTVEINYEYNHHRAKSGVSYLDKFSILIPFVVLMLILFMIYYVYSLIFYFIFRSSYNDFILTSDFSNKNTDLDNKMMNNINLLCTMMILNKTEVDLSYDLTGLKNKVMMELLTNILTIRTEITKYKKTNEKFKSIDSFENNLMNCTYIYTSLNDTIFYELQQIEEDGNLIESLISICNSYAFMKTSRIDSIFDEISYSSLHLYNLYDFSNKTYTDIANIYENYMFYDVFLIFMFIFRPIRKFSSDYIYNTIITLSSDNYLVFTIVYLILNIIVDLFIFYIINRMVVKKISDINRHLNNMITCISFKFSNNNKK